MKYIAAVVALTLLSVCSVWSGVGEDHHHHGWFGSDHTHAHPCGEDSSIWLSGGAPQPEERKWANGEARDPLKFHHDSFLKHTNHGAECSVNEDENYIDDDLSDNSDDSVYRSNTSDYITDNPAPPAPPAEPQFPEGIIPSDDIMIVRK